jgi:hypothetical protein
MPHVWYYRDMNTNGAGNGVECRLVVGGVEYTFTMAGPLVSMAPASEKAEKKQSKRGRK